MRGSGLPHINRKPDRWLMLNQRTQQLLIFSLLAAGLLLATLAGGGQVDASVQQNVDTMTVSLDIEGMT